MVEKKIKDDFNLDSGPRNLIEWRAWNLFVVASCVEISLEAYWVLGVQVRSFPAVITEVTLDPRHIWKWVYFIYFQRPTLWAISVACGYWIVSSATVGFHSTVGIWLNYERHRGCAKSKGTRFELLKYLFWPINRDPPTNFYTEGEEDTHNSGYRVLLLIYILKK